MTIDEVISVLEMQEEILQFSHFTNADAEKRRFGDDQYPAEQRVYRVPVRL